MKQRKVWTELALRALLVLYLYLLIKIILFKFHPIDAAFLRQRLEWSLGEPGDIVERIREGNLIPFREISRTLHSWSSRGFVNLIGNVAIFVPYGILLGLVRSGKRGSAAAALLCSFGVSFGLESAQAVFAIGSFDVDDLILNTGGGLIGFAVLKGIAAAASAPSLKSSAHYISNREAE